MSQLIAIGEALDFVERHLKEEIAVADMADAAGYSLYHFCRVFNGLVHHTPYDYLMRRRLSQSARSLLEIDWQIIDIAFEYQFNNHETYSRAFKRMFGVPPSHYRAQHSEPSAPPDRRLWMPRLTLAYLRHINQGDGLKPTLIKKDALHLVGLMSLIQDEDAATIPQLWQLLAQELTRLEDGEASYEHYGITWHPSAARRDTCFYLAAVEAPFPADQVHSGLVAKTLPPLTYARFEHRGPRRALNLTRGYIYHTWLPQSDVVLAPLEIEIEYHRREAPPLAHEAGPWEILIPIQSPRPARAPQ